MVALEPVAMRPSVPRDAQPYVADGPAFEAVLGLIGLTARILFTNGQTSFATRQVVRQVGQALGVQADVLLRWGEVVIHVDGHSIAPLTGMAPTGVHMGRVAATLGIVERLRRGALDVASARAELESVSRMPPVPTWQFALLAALGAGALGIIFGSADPLTLALIVLSAGLGALLRRGLARFSDNILIQPFGAALLAGVIGALAVKLQLAIDPRLVLLCPCMVLVPGPHVLNGTIDLARTNIGLGIERLALAAVIVAMICAGLLLGLSLGNVSLNISGPGAPVPLLYDVLAAGMAVAAYGTFFSMSWRVLPIPILVGMVAHAARWGLMASGASLPEGAFVACLIVGIVVTPIADRLRYPFAAFAFASVVSMVPGVFLFDTAGALLELSRQGAAATASPALLTVAAVDGMTALLTVFAMTAGLIVPKIVIERIMRVQAARRA